MFKRFVATATIALGLITLAVSFGVCLAIIFTGIARSQPAAPTANEQALGVKLMTEIQAGLACSANTITAQKRIEELEKRLKELETMPARKGP